MRPTSIEPIAPASRWVGPLPEPRFDHLRDMTTPRGLWEHADHTRPRIEHGFCTDDNARALIVLLREKRDEPAMAEMVRTYMQFIQEAAIPTGGFHNRRRADGAWVDTIGSYDSQGRALWALGSSVRLSRDSSMRSAALELWERQVFESPSPRAHAFAILGASEILAVEPTNSLACEAVRKGASHLHVAGDPDWPWPETRLAYQNAHIPEAMLAAGQAIGNDHMIETGLALLRWLLSIESGADHFSFTPVGGWAPGEPRPGFDQQPTEAAAMADACARAWRLTGDASWADAVLMAGAWLIGANDRNAVLYDADTGGCCDGLTPYGPNLNQGAESTLAALSTLQQVRMVSSPADPQPATRRIEADDGSTIQQEQYR